MKEPKEGIIQISAVVVSGPLDHKTTVVYGLSNYGRTYKLDNGEWQLIAGELD